MPELIAQSAENAEFPRIIELTRLRDASEFDFNLVPTDTEAKALARLMGAQSVPKLRFAGRLEALDPAGWRLDARLAATVIQTCVVTLEPVTTRIDAPVHRTYLPITGPRPVDIDVSEDDDEEIEPLPDRLDLGLIATEALALALPPYPRKPGATLEPASFAGAGVRPLRDDEVKPFSALAALRDKLGKGS
jgi:uncharacterized metal-binding protein YceD (DUF177 family)